MNNLEHILYEVLPLTAILGVCVVGAMTGRLFQKSTAFLLTVIGMVMFYGFGLLFIVFGFTLGFKMLEFSAKAFFM